MKKRLALLMALVMVFSLCCFSAPTAFADDVTLTLWSIATESDSSHQAFVDGIAAFEAEHPGVKIEHVTTENEAYKTKIKAAMSSGEGLPDIFFTWGMGFLGEFVNAGRVYCVDAEYESYKDELPEAMTVNVRYDNKMFGVPYTMSLVTLYANMDLLAQVGYEDIPATYEDMIVAPETAKVKEGIRLFTQKLGEKAAKRAPQADAVAKAVAESRHSSIIVMGDFNDPPVSYPHYVISKHLEDTFAESGCGLGISYHLNHFYFRLDNIMVSPNLQSYKCQVDNQIDTSDHYPIYCFVAKKR